MDGGTNFTPEAAERISRAVRLVESRGGGNPTLPSQARVQQIEVVRVRVTGSASGGLYPGVVTWPVNHGADWEDAEVAVKVKAAEGETLTSGTRYPCQPAGETVGGDPLYMTIADAAGAAEDVAYSLTVKETDGSPSVSDVDTISVDRTTGASVAAGGAGEAVVSLLEAGPYQWGVITGNAQSFLGEKLFASGLKARVDSTNWVSLAGDDGDFGGGSANAQIALGHGFVTPVVDASIGASGTGTLIELVSTVCYLSGTYTGVSWSINYTTGGLLAPAPLGSGDPHTEQTKCKIRAYGYGVYDIDEDGIYTNTYGVSGTDTAGSVFVRGICTTVGTTPITPADGSITYAKLQDVTSKRILGRYAATTGVCQEISVGTGLDLSDAGVLTCTASGTVTSVGLTAPSSILTVSGSPVTTSGTLALSLVAQAANTVFRGPATGADATPSFGPLVAADIPSLDAGKITTGTIATARLGSGTADSTTFLRGDQTWATVTSGAPVGAQYLVATADGTLTAERVTTDTATISWDHGTTGQAKANVVDGSISNAKLRNSAALSVIGNATNASASPADITAGTDGHVLRRSGTALGFGTVATAGIADGAVTLAKIANLTANRILGRFPTSGGAPQELTLGGGLGITAGGALTTYNYALPGGWVKFNGTGTVAILNSYNVSSITDHGTGDYSINWDVDFGNADYAVSLVNEVFAFATVRSGGQTAGALRIGTYNGSVVASDPVGVHVVAWGT